MSIPAILMRAGEWLLNSGIQEPPGGVARYYQADIQENRLISTEITGYAVSTFLALHDQLRDDTLLAGARRAAQYLAREAFQPTTNLFPCDRASGGEQPEPFAYFFDCGIIVRGLLALWRRTGDVEMLRVATLCGRAMLRDFSAGPAGEFHPIIALPSKEPLPREPRWSRSAACYQLKAATAFHALHEAAGDSVFHEAYEAALAFALRTHSSFLPGTDSETAIMDRCHAYLYFAEGLLPRAGRPECAEAMLQVIAAVTRYTRQLEPVFLRSDVVAQLLRARINAESLKIQTADRLEAEWEVRHLTDFAARSSDTRIHGGFWFGRRDGKMVPHVTPVAVGFAVQALMQWEKVRAGKLEPANPQWLI